MEKYILTETSYFGRGCRTELPTIIKDRNFRKVLLVTDQSLIDAGVVSKVTTILDQAKIKFKVFSDVEPNPTINNVLAGVNVCKEFEADVILAVGGGSPMDTAKGISIVITNPDRADIVSLNGLSNTLNPGLPLICVPTTHGTASEVTINYVITDPDRKIKMVCVDPHDLPIVAVVDSELMETMPKSLASSTGMDALTHAIEGYIAKGKTTMSQMMSLKAIELIFENLASAVNDKDAKAIENMALAQYIAGMAFSNCGLGIVHSMAHQLGAVYNTPHGLANTLLLPTVMRFNGEVCANDFREILCHIGRPDAKDLNDQDVINTFVWKIEELSKSIGINQTIKDVGCREEDLDMLADKAMEDPCRPGNPRETTKEDFIRLYREAM
ncbi:MAG: iron-containing alcohol dehydrogenase [Clostridia bacterium]|nr:iron-containing alcohol dehydrogenase [Clostridia bacterium]